jgi:peptide chain release factor 2
MTETLQEIQERIEAIRPLLQLDQKQEEKKRVEAQMQDTGFWDDPQKAAKVSKQYEWLSSYIDDWTQLEQDLSNLRSLVEEFDLDLHPDLKQEAEDQCAAIKETFDRLETAALLSEKHDQDNALISIHAGSGGTEAQDWADMLRRMLVRYCDAHDFSVTILEESLGQEAGIKSSLLRVEGPFAYGYLKSEHGTHRLVRISPFDGDGMRHTSFAGIEVIPEIEHEDIEISENDLRIDTFMASGNGGQSVNTTYSAVRIVHIPTGIMVQCQNEKSQQQNKIMAMKVLMSRLQQKKEEEEAAQMQQLKGEYKQAAWGNQIRSYVMQPYTMVKDVRTKHETPHVQAVLDGDLDPFIHAYLRMLQSS